MKKTEQIIGFIILCLIMGCEKKTVWSLQNEQKETIIVDGMITNEKKVHQIKLTFPVQQLNDIAQPVSGAVVLISDKDSVYTLTENPVQKGIYETSSYFIGKVGNYYNLYINYNNEKIITARSILLREQTFNPIKYEQVNNTDLYQITWIADDYNAENYAMYEVLLDWSMVPGYETLNPDSCKARLLYYTLPTIDVSQVFAPDKQKIYFPKGTIVNEKRYSITREHAEFVRALLAETNWQGGLFDSAHSGLPGNIEGEASGFFAACGVSTLSLIIN